MTAAARAAYQRFIVADIGVTVDRELVTGNDKDAAPNSASKTPEMDDHLE